MVVVIGSNDGSGSGNGTMYSSNGIVVVGSNGGSGR